MAHHQHHHCHHHQHRRHQDIYGVWPFVVNFCNERSIFWKSSTRTIVIQAMEEAVAAVTSSHPCQASRSGPSCQQHSFQWKQQNPMNKIKQNNENKKYFVVSKDFIFNLEFSQLFSSIVLHPFIPQLSLSLFLTHLMIRWDHLITIRCHYFSFVAFISL